VQVLDGESHQVSVIDYARKSGRDPEPLKVLEDLLGLNPSDQVIELAEPIIAREIRGMVENSDHR
jgi:hypothetical protein